MSFFSDVARGHMLKYFEMKNGEYVMDESDLFGYEDHEDITRYYSKTFI